MAVVQSEHNPVHVQLQDESWSRAPIKVFWAPPKNAKTHCPTRFHPPPREKAWASKDLRNGSPRADHKSRECETDSRWGLLRCGNHVAARKEEKRVLGGHHSIKYKLRHKGSVQCMFFFFKLSVFRSVQTSGSQPMVKSQDKHQRLFLHHEEDEEEEPHFFPPK